MGKIFNYDVIMTSYMGCLFFFGMYGKRKPIAIPWYQISILQVFISQGELQHPAPWLNVLQKISWLDEDYKYYIGPNGVVPLLPSFQYTSYHSNTPHPTLTKKKKINK